MMEIGELKKYYAPGSGGTSYGQEEAVLEIYHKPTDLKRKKFNLHSVKPLYFHVTPRFLS